MSERIKPALSPDEWERARSGCDDIGHHYYTGDKGAVIAIANDELPDSDQRKITRERVRWLRALAEELEFDDCTIDTEDEPPDRRERRLRQIAEARALADALASYLPPA